MPEITPFDAAREFGRDYETIMRYCREGLVPAEKRDGRWFIDYDALAVYAHAHGWLEKRWGETGRPSKARKAIRRLLTEAAAASPGRELTLRYAAGVVCEEMIGHEMREGTCIRCGKEGE